MNDQMVKILRGRGKLLALFIVCGSAVSALHQDSAAAIFAAIAAPVSVFVGFEAWASRGAPNQGE